MDVEPSDTAPCTVTVWPPLIVNLPEFDRVPNTHMPLAVEKPDALAFVISTLPNVLRPGFWVEGKLVVWALEPLNRVMGAPTARNVWPKPPLFEVMWPLISSSPAVIQL